MQGRSWRLLALSTAAYLGFCLFMPFQLPFYFDSGLSTGEIALLTTVQGLAAGLGAWMGGQACRRWNTQVATGLGSWCVVAAASGHLLLPPTVLGMVMPAGAIGVATGCLLVGFTQMMYASVGRGSNAIYAALTALLLGGQIGLMALSAGIGSVLERVGIPYPTPMFTAAAVTALAGAWWLTRSLSRTQASR
jgi:predicted MFS family arabinose efflux permease